MATEYRVKRATIVPVSIGSGRMPGGGLGGPPQIVSSRVAREGESFTSLPQNLVDQIEAGELDEFWERVEVPDPVEPLTEEEQAAFADLDLKAMESDDLQKIADRLELYVEGTGTAGRVLKRDLVAALEAERAKMGQEE